MIQQIAPVRGDILCAIERASTAHVRRAQAHGGTVRARERVLDWEPVGDGVRVRTDRGTYAGDHLVVSSETWARKLLEFLSGKLRPDAFKVPSRVTVLDRSLRSVTVREWNIDSPR
ncbi:hypothetical protein ACFPM1_02990 [Halorubrum rubrum]|uniref:Uncharacterized protein n=1 Tax=Halorubrum rubrum TaxID=1126240 RepID=A0ABD5QYI5_9EURY|nr:hypothetical protein [Halorubrum rubrum]